MSQKKVFNTEGFEEGQLINAMGVDTGIYKQMDPEAKGYVSREMWMSYLERTHKEKGKMKHVRREMADAWLAMLLNSIKRNEADDDDDDDDDDDEEKNITEKEVIGVEEETSVKEEEAREGTATVSSGGGLKGKWGGVKGKVKGKEEGGVQDNVHDTREAQGSIMDKEGTESGKYEKAENTGAVGGEQEGSTSMDEMRMPSRFENVSELREKVVDANTELYEKSKDVLSRPRKERKELRKEVQACCC